jgi:NitT/TauT family transport system permease protein
MMEINHVTEEKNIVGIDQTLSKLDSVKSKTNPTFTKKGVILPREVVWPVAVTYTLQAAIICCVILVWELGVRFGIIDTFFWSSPSQIWKVGLISFTKGDILYDTWFTFRATFIGFILGTFGGSILGLSLWWSRNLATIVEPYIITFNAVPKLAFAPLLILLFGIGIASKIALAIALTIVITALAAHAGVKAVDQDLVRMIYSLGGKRWDVFLKVVVPSSMPWIISSLRINIGLALAGTIVAEFVGSQYGLGKLILYAGSTYEMGLIWVGVIILSLVAIAMYVGVVKLEKILLRGMHSSNLL